MQQRIPARRSLLVAFATVTLLWLSQPPLGWWPFVFVALVPLLTLTESNVGRPQYWSLWLASAVYWLVSLQGLRHAHPLMFLCWFALGGYLGIYLPLFVLTTRVLTARRVPLAIAAAVAWVGWECVRNYALTGISAVMLGHALVDVPQMIQVADLFGTYGVSFIVVVVNAAIYQTTSLYRGFASRRQATATGLAAVALLILTAAYGQYRIEQSLIPSDIAIALIQCDEQTEYAQDYERQLEIYQSYVDQSLKTLRKAAVPVDAVVWPESMLSGGLPWREIDQPLEIPPDVKMAPDEYRQAVFSNREYFLARADELQRALSSFNQQKRPDLIGGCAVIDHGESVSVYSGVIHVDSSGDVSGWYGKTHLVMFGEYIPLANSLPGFRSLVPQGMGLAVGEGPKTFAVGENTILPNLCIETAVERVVINQLRSLRASDIASPEMIVTVTNDAWFDHSSVISHHLRCAQLVAVGARRPILSAANGGPTAWINSKGQIVEKLDSRAFGGLIAQPQIDNRSSLYSRIGDWPAKVIAAVCLLSLIVAYLERRRLKRAERDA